MIDAAVIGEVAALAMQDADEDADFSESARVVGVVVIVEVRDEEAGERCSSCSVRVSDDHSTLGLGLLERARDALAK